MEEKSKHLTLNSKDAKHVMYASKDGKLQMGESQSLSLIDSRISMAAEKIKIHLSYQWKTWTIYKQTKKVFSCCMERGIQEAILISITTNL